MKRHVAGTLILVTVAVLLFGGVLRVEESQQSVSSVSEWKPLPIFKNLVTAGDRQSLAIKDGYLWAWGSGYFGFRTQCQNGMQVNASLSRRIGSDDDHSWVSVVAGRWHVLGIKEDGSLWAWGINGDGQLGDGTIKNKCTLVRIQWGMLRPKPGASPVR